MTFSKNRLAASMLLAALTLTAPQLLAGGGHGHHDDDHVEAEDPKGPNGGTLLSEGAVDLEITVFERGVPPEMRVYAYRDGQLLDPAQVELSVALGRLGGVTDTLSFVAEGDYLVSEQVVTEPHSFDVRVKAQLEGERYQWDYASHEGRTTLSDRLLALSGVDTAVAKGQTLRFTETLFGVVQPAQERLFSVSAPYNGMVERLYVNIGDRVEQGQAIAEVRSNDTLQRYTVTAPADGEVIAQWLSVGDQTNGQALLQLADLSQVWIDLSAFPQALEKIAVGMPLTVLSMHDAERCEGGARSRISYIAPTMTGGHIARARAVIDNADGQWRPGMHVQARVLTEQREVPLAVHVDALQRFRDMDVVFGRYGNTFEVRMVTLGDSDGEYVEVLEGLAPGTEYVTVNSYLMIADVSKDAAKHDH
ncbi:efflux RND transporter periplasmic adaptor subunit [Ferrimonas balearica]|uniref:efflux RND transporter periplasmic adaptor subunit n=1 Tax=Ferrimonas balearica TaxID=44012 RepID=UPI001C990DB0|nr:efflux RND transporter periplasmic adaptor subunit [Ferrimonas balearica]MBY5991313.1 efflux RND transporter periplasmic adaptor subunit [Ferrimonas balearica]